MRQGQTRTVGELMNKHRSKHLEQQQTPPGGAAQSYGILTEWNDERGYGFITPNGGGQKVFLHIKSLLPSARRPVAGEVFFYKLTADAKGRPRAEAAYQTVFDEKRSTPLHHSLVKVLARLWPLAVIPPVLLAVRTGSPVSGVIAAFVVNSLLTVLFYREDKYLAQYKYWRIPEKYLHIWEFLCGWPGALYAQHAFCHKRNKTGFLIDFWLCVIANIAVLCLLFFYADPATVGKALGDWWRWIRS